MAITHLAFDMDGVIFSAEEFIEDAYRNSIIESKLSIRHPAGSEIIKQFGKPVKEIFQNLFGGLSDDDFKVLRPLMLKEITKEITAGRGFIYDGIANAVKSLSGYYTLAVCSNAGPDYVDLILKQYGLKELFLPALTLVNMNLTNKSELLAAYIINSKTSGKEWVMFGDRYTDLEAAKNNKCFFAACMWGFGNEAELKDADMFLNSPQEIISRIESLNKKKNP